MGGKKMTFAITLIFILLLIFLVGLYFFNIAVCKKTIGTKRKIGEHVELNDEQSIRFSNGTDWFLHQSNAKKVSFTNSLRETYYGDLILNKNSKNFVILVHGYRSNALKNFAPIIEKYYNMGFSILMPELPAHGQSYGNYITFGCNESLIMIAWAYWLIKRFGSNISIVYNGVSMGAAAVTMMSGEELPSNIKGIIADSGYTSAIDIFKYILKKDFNLPSFPIVNIANLISCILADFSFRDCAPIEAVKKATVPMLFFHGTEDKFVPYQMAVELYTACSSPIKELVLTKNAGHCMSYLVDTKTCDEKIENFLNRIL